MTNSNQPYVILVEPQLAENVGTAARAMMNCGLYNMRLVNPREDHLSAKAISASSNAEEILENAEIFGSTADAIADLHYVAATTARHRDQTKQVFTADRAAAELNNKCREGIRTGILFGPERTGLHNDDVSLADAIINIPLNPRHCSLNLSQAVLLAGYEFYKTHIQAPEEQFVINHTQLADKEKVLAFCGFLENKMEGCGNYKIDVQREKLVINLRNIFTRRELTEQELNTLYGIINYISKTKD